MAKKENDKEKSKGILASLHGVAHSLKTPGQNAKPSEKKTPDKKTPDKKLTEKKVTEKRILEKKVPEKESAQRGKGPLTKTPGKAAPETPDKPLEIKAISTRSAIKIIFYLMAADGEIFNSEEEKFDAIGSELDPNFAENKAQIVEECKAQMEKIIDPEDDYDVLRDGIELALASSVQTEDTFVTPKLLVWNLLTVAYSDGHYNESERRLLKCVVRKLNVDKAVFLEMESSIQTLTDLENELSWIKTTDRPYLTIEAMVNEIIDRRDVIFESVKDLIAL